MKGAIMEIVTLSQEKGTYILIAYAAQMVRMKIGRLGEFDIIPGYYAYVGSAFGSGGIESRIRHHLESVAAPHWHIDYLLSHAQPVEVWYALSDRKLEHDWAELLTIVPQFRIPIPRFGSSDYRRSRVSHLFYSKKRPSFRWFLDLIHENFESDIQPQQCILKNGT